MSTQKTRLGWNITFTLLRQYRYLLIIPTILLAVLTLFPRMQSSFAIGFHSILYHLYLYIISNIILVLLWNFKLFSVLHKRAAVDRLLALPFSKANIFTTMQITGLIGSLLPSLLVFLVNLPFSIGAPELGTSVWLFLRIVLMTVYSFFFVQFLMLITGKLVDAAVSVALVSMMWPALVSLYVTFTGKFLPTFAISGDNRFFNVFRYLLSPFAAMLFDTFNDSFATWLRIVMTGILFAACLWLFIKRPAEWSESRWVKTPSFHLVRLIAAPTIAMIGGYLAFLIRKAAVNVTTDLTVADGSFVKKIGMMPFYIGFVISLIIVFWAFHLIGGKRKHGFLYSAILAVVVLAVTAGWLGFVQSSASGYSERVPEVKNVESVTIRDNSLLRFNKDTSEMIFTEPEDIAVIHASVESTLTEDNPGLALPRTLQSNELYHQYVDHLTDKLRQNRVAGDDPVSLIDQYVPMEKPYSMVELEWKLKNGYVMKRNYQLPLAVGSDLWRVYSQNPVFILKLQQYSFWQVKVVSDGFKDFSLSKTYNRYTFKDEIPDEVVVDNDEIVQAMQSDFNGKAVSVIKDSDPDGPSLILYYGIPLRNIMDLLALYDIGDPQQFVDQLKKMEWVWIDRYKRKMDTDRVKSFLDTIDIHNDDGDMLNSYDKSLENIPDYLVVYGKMKIPYSETDFPKLTKWLFERCRELDHNNNKDK